MSKINTGGPAFPVQSYVNADGETFESEPQGMTLRDYFAAKAMQAYCSHSESIYGMPDEIAGDAYAIADAMLKARDAKT